MAASYGEADVEILKRQREFVLPKTARGKEKKLNYTNVSSVKAEEITFLAGIKENDAACYISTYNRKNNASLPFYGIRAFTE
ncbi:hypothetical protein MKX30_06695 [Paenibacillus sp. FSL P2-0173]